MSQPQPPKNKEEAMRLSRKSDFSHVFLRNAPRLTPPVSSDPETQLQREKECLIRLMQQAQALQEDPHPREGGFQPQPPRSEAEHKLYLQKHPTPLSRSLSQWAGVYLNASEGSNEYHFDDRHLKALRTLVSLLVQGDDPLPRAQDYASTSEWTAALLRSVSTGSHNKFYGESWMRAVLCSRLAIHAVVGWHRAKPDDFRVSTDERGAFFGGLPPAAWFAAACGARAGTLFLIGQLCQRAWPGRKAPAWPDSDTTCGDSLVAQKDDVGSPKEVVNNATEAEIALFWRRMAVECGRAGNADALWALRDRVALHENVLHSTSGSPLQEWIAASAASVQMEAIVGGRQTWIIEQERLASQFWDRLERFYGSGAHTSLGLDLAEALKRVQVPRPRERAHPTPLPEASSASWEECTIDHLWQLAIVARKVFALQPKAAVDVDDDAVDVSAFAKRQREMEVQLAQSRQRQWQQQERRESYLQPAPAPDGLTLASWCRASVLRPNALQHWNASSWADKALFALRSPLGHGHAAAHRLWIQRSIDWSSSPIQTPLVESMNSALRGPSDAAQEAALVFKALVTSALGRAALESSKLPEQASWMFWALALEARERLENWPKTARFAQQFLEALSLHPLPVEPQTLQEVQAGATVSSQNVHSIAFVSGVGKEQKSREAVMFWRTNVLSTDRWQPWTPSPGPTEKRATPRTVVQTQQLIEQAFEQAWGVWEKEQMKASLGERAGRETMLSEPLSKRRPKHL